MNFEPCNWAKTSTQLAEDFPSTPWRYLNSTTPEGEKPLKIRENPRSRSARKRNIARKFLGVQVEGKKRESTLVLRLSKGMRCLL